ncbi:MAG: metallophosphoesterase [Bacteroidetes bacterium]|nr:metallophosphoesterase [Bacteroidota bacterium]
MTILSRIIFFTVIFSIIFGLQFLVYKTFSRYLRSKFTDSHKLKLFYLYPFILLNLPYLYLLINVFTSSRTPFWWVNYGFIPFYIFQGSVIFIGLYLLIGKLIKAPFTIPYYILNKFEYFRTRFSKVSENKSIKKIDSSRRAFIKTSAAFVSGYAFIGATTGVLSKNDYRIENVDLKISGLPEELKGTTISFISDIHSGPYMDELLMKEYCGIINDLNSDLIMIAGDLTNSQKEEVFPFVKAFKDLKAPHGIYSSLGNHDYFSDPDFIAHIVSNESPVKILRNESELIKIKGKDLCLFGIEDTRQSGSAPDNILINYLDETISSSKKKISEKGIDYDKIPKIALFHKPYFFNQIQDRGIDLYLSGHTHGGQVVLAEFGKLNISFAGAVSEFIKGLYKTPNSQMYISRGIGCVALPLRLNCPPEITKIRLI